MSETQNSDAGKSFAERFASKKNDPASQRSSFTSQHLKSPESDDNKENSDETSKKNISNVDPQKKSKAELIYLVKGVDAGRNAWYYVLVERLKVQLFLKALNDEIIHLENYGIILFSAYGDEPPADITDSLKEEYGIA